MAQTNAYRPWVHDSGFHIDQSTRYDQLGAAVERIPTRGLSRSDKIVDHENLVHMRLQDGLKSFMRRMLLVIGQILLRGKSQHETMGEALVQVFRTHVQPPFHFLHLGYHAVKAVEGLYHAVNRSLGRSLFESEQNNMPQLAVRRLGETPEHRHREQHDHHNFFHAFWFL
jgi:hypothetical protein